MPIDLTQSVLVGMQAMQETSRRKFGYEAAEDSHRRKSTAAVISSEDDVLDASRRRKLQASGLDIQRNFAIAAWAIRKHLDFVTSFSFSSNNAQEVLGEGEDAAAQALQAERSSLDDDIEGVIAEASAAENCDTAGRHPLNMMLRLCEARATVAGDHCFLEVDDGTWQAIESDRVLTPQGDKENVVHGVRLNKRGQSVAYAVHSRKGTGYTFERWVPSSSTVWRGYYDRFDQVRGISPMAPALNPLRDLHEGFVYALAKAKIAQLFGFKVNHGGDTGIAETIETAERKRYAIELGKGPWNIDLDPGDDIEIMTAEVPGDGFESFSEMMIAISLLAIDLPWNFYKVDATNFFGSRAALNLYLKSVKTKREANQSLLRRWTRRQLQFAIVRGKLRLPRSLTVDDLRYTWTPDGMPWWNPSQEADGALKSIGGALDNPQDICLATGSNVFRNIDRIAEVQRYAKGKGVTLSYAVPPSITIQPNQ